MIGAGILCAVVLIGTGVVNRLVDVERYRPALVAALKDATGMPASVARMRLRILPTPVIVAYDISIGEGDCRLLIRHATASLSLSSFAQHHIAIGRITLASVSLVLPKDLSTLRALAERFHKPVTASASSPDFDVDALYVSSGEIRQSEGGPILATFDGMANALTSDTVPVRATAKLPVWGKEAQFDMEGTVAPRQGPAVQAYISFGHVSLAALTGRPLGGAIADLTAEVKLLSLEEASVELTGSVVGAPHDALNGSLSAVAQWQGGALTVNDINWASPCASLEANLTWNPPRQLTCRIVNAFICAAALDAFAELQRSPEFRLKVRKEASLTLQDLMVGVNDAGEMRVPQGALSLHGIDLFAANGKLLLANLYVGVGVEEGVVHMNELSAEGLRLTGTLRPDWPSRSIGIEAGGTVLLTPAWLALAPASFPLAGLNGECVFDKMSATLVAGQGFPRDFTANGSVKKASANLTVPGHPQPLAISDLSGSVGFKDGELTLDTVAANGLVLSGAVRAMNGAIAVDLRGKASLAQIPLGFFVSRDLLSDWGGTLTVETFKATFAGKGIPADVQLTANIENGRATLSLPGYVDFLSDVNAHVKVDSQTVNADLELSSAQVRTLKLEGGYEARTGAIHGSLTADLAQCALPFLKSIPARKTWFPIIERTGLSTFRINAGWPPSERGDVPVTIARDSEPGFNATVTLSRRTGEWTLSQMDMSLTAPLELLKPVIPEYIQVEGNAVLRAQSALDSPQWILTADLTDADAVIGEYLYKTRGDALLAHAACEMKSGGLDLNSVHARYCDVDVPVRIQDGGLFVDNIDIDLAALAGLLPKDGSAHGHLSGSFGTKPLAAVLELDGLGAFVAPRMGFSNISGKITVNGTHVVLDKVRAQGLDSDCTFNAELIDGVFHGRANGARLNLNDVIHFIDHLKDYRWNPKPENENGSWQPSPFACDLQTALDTLVYRNGSAQNVTGTFSMHEEVVRATNLVATPYTGRLTGSLVVEPKRNKVPGKVVLDFEVRDAEARFIDEMVFDEPRGLAGTITGMVSMSIGTGDDSDAIEKTNGGFTFDGKHGSLGTIAFANALSEMLKTTTLIRLRLPEYGKDALGFDQCHAVVAMKDGVWAILEANTKNPYLSMTGEGVIDFPRKATDVRLRINFLESVTGLIERLPLIGSTISKVNGLTGLNLVVYDSPYDMKVRINPAQIIEDVGKKADKVTDTLTKPFPVRKIPFRIRP